MSFPITINSSNYVNNNTYRIELSRTIDLSDFEVAVGSAYVYYSWYNISAALQNDIIQITFPGVTSETIVIPKGIYQFSDLNNFLQFWFIEKGYYIINDITGIYTYYASFQVNPTGYSVQWITYPLPTSLPSGYTSGGMSFPASPNQHVQLTVLSNNFRNLIGYRSGIYPTLPTNVGIQTQESTSPPDISPISSIQMRLSCVYNLLSSNSTTIHVFNNQSSGAGESINGSPLELQYVPCIGSHKTVTLQFYDQLGNYLDMLDRNISVKLNFRSKI